VVSGATTGHALHPDRHHPGAVTGNRRDRAIDHDWGGALTFIAFTPEGPLSQFTTLSIQIFNWISRPQAGFADTAAAGIVVLLAVLLSMNALAIGLRSYFERRRKW
jgi:hypothetical protein